MLLAVGVLLLGSGVLAPWWLLADAPTQLPGWLDFRAAAVGDTLLLPTLTAALWHTMGKPNRRTLLQFGAVGLAGGAALQAGWLLDDSPRLNWTFPAPHVFNAAGWYHALFLCLMCAVLTALGAALFRERATRSTGQHDSIIAFTLCGFALLQTLDIVRPAGPDADRASSSGLASAALTVLAVVIALVAVSPRRADQRRRYLPASATGVGLSLVLALVCVRWPGNAVWGFAAGVVCIATAAWIDHRLGEQARAARREHPASPAV